MGLNSAYTNFEKAQKSATFQNTKMPNPNHRLDSAFYWFNFTAISGVKSIQKSP